MWLLRLLLTLSIISFSSTFLLDEVPFEINPLIIHWEDNDVIRGRLKASADLHLAEKSHFKNREFLIESNKVVSDHKTDRSRRDLGLLTSPVATAVVTGMIGMTAKVVSDITSYHSNPSSGGCEWFGTAPLCNHACPSDYDYVRGHNGRCSNFWLASTCKPDDSFGEPCSTLLGSFFKKRFCCKLAFFDDAIP
ncbi:unnamed protein product [Bursaphelenchus xylophilus]|uniref:(pine wood nematode) hypothetical protein n=1 Tax=Bursaphelenchus xylophilus TaxID=6326 RepID=A0A1I7S387_BURXY|nr:unnamed protein product [Bursaphelenchus xylophilus]CAG9116135.1 unnamed protein product [Bursaphelenchus xylophilus]